MDRVMIPFPVERILAKGVWAEVALVRTPSGLAVCKMARRNALPPTSTRPVGCTTALRQITGGVIHTPLDPSAVIARERDHLARVRHSGLVELLDHGEVDGRPWILLEWLDGPTVRELLFRKTFTPDDLLRIARALAELSRLGWRHGDIKPENLVRASDGRLVMIDPSAGSWRREEDGLEQMLLTPTYNPLLEPSDVPALGLVLGECLAGRPLLGESEPERKPPRRPFSREAEGWAANLVAAGRGDALETLRGLQLPRELDPDIPAEIEAVVLGSLGLRGEPDGTLGRATPFGDPATFTAALEAALGGKRG